MYVSDEQLTEREAVNPAVVSEAVQIKPLNLGNIYGTFSIDQKIHSVILQRTMGTRAAAEVTGMVPQRIKSVYSNGQSTQGGPVVKELIEGIEEKTGEIRDAAAAHVLIALGAITKDEISGSNLKDKIHVAERLSGVMERMNNGSDGKRFGAAVQVNLYVPRVRDVEEYEVIEK